MYAWLRRPDDLLALDVRERAADPLDARFAVHDEHGVGQVLGERAPLRLASPQLLFGALALRDVDERDHCARERARSVPRRHRAEDGPRRLTVGAADPDRDRLLWLARREHPRHRVLGGGAGRAVLAKRRRLEARDEALREIVEAIAQDPDCLGVRLDDRAVRGDMHDPAGDGIEDDAHEARAVLEIRASLSESGSMPKGRDLEFHGSVVSATASTVDRPCRGAKDVADVSLRRLRGCRRGACGAPLRRGRSRSPTCRLGPRPSRCSLAPGRRADRGCSRRTRARRSTGRDRRRWFRGGGASAPSPGRARGHAAGAAIVGSGEDALVRAVVARGHAQLAADAGLRVDARDELVGEIEVAPLLVAAHGAPAELVTLFMPCESRYSERPSIMSRTMR